MDNPYTNGRYLTDECLPTPIDRAPDPRLHRAWRRNVKFAAAALAPALERVAALEGKLRLRDVQFTEQQTTLQWIVNASKDWATSPPDQAARDLAHINRAALNEMKPLNDKEIGA